MFYQGSADLFAITSLLIYHLIAPLKLRNSAQRFRNSHKPVCIIGNEGEDISGYTAEDNEPKQEEHREEKRIKPEAAPQAQVIKGGGVFISPRAKRAAVRLGVDAAAAVPTGAGGYYSRYRERS